MVSGAQNGKIKIKCNESVYSQLNYLYLSIFTDVRKMPFKYYLFHKLQL